MSGERWRIGTRARERAVHPGAWWVWALGLAVAASRTSNPLVLLLIGCAAAVVVHARRPAAPWARSFEFFVRLGAFVIVLRVVVQVVFGAAIGSTLLLPLPGLELPDWMAGVRLGGDVMLESVLMAFYEGLRLATILICVGAANALASPSRLLKSMPTALYEVGVSVAVALTFTPQLVADVTRVRSARHLRGRVTRGPRAIAGAAVPVLEGALERSVALAAAMDARGYGRRASQAPAHRRVTAALLLGGLVAACIATYGLVASGSPWAMQLPLLVMGLSCAAMAMHLSARGSLRTRYRPDPWWAPEWCVAGAGLVTALAVTMAAIWEPVAMATATDPPTWPALPLLAIVGVVVAMSPALTAPRLPTASSAAVSRAPMAVVA